MKKIALCIILMMILLITPMVVFAEENNVAKIGTKEYATLEEAVENANKGDVITIIKDITLDKSLEINDGKEITIDLNNHIISAQNKTVSIQNAKVTLTGKGTVKENTMYYGALYLKGSNNENDTNYTVVNIGKDVTLSGWTAIFVTPYTSKGNPYAYGVVVNCDGTMNGLTDSDGGVGSGIYINGQIKHTKNAPIINLGSTAKITATGSGIYAAGFANWKINGAEIGGVGAGLGIKAGTFDIKNANIYSNGTDERPTQTWSNGINPSGAAVQIESNVGYAKNIDLKIDGGTYTSKNGVVFYEYMDKNTTETSIKSLRINNVSFVSEAKKEDFDLSTVFKSNVKNFVTSGNFESDVTDYISAGNVCKKIDGKYAVAKENNIKIVNATNGTITTDKSKAIVGETVTLTVKENEEYKLKTLTVLDANQKEVKVENNKFTMPNSEVTIKAEFVKTTKEAEVPAIDSNKEVEKVTIGIENKEKTEKILIDSVNNNKELAEKIKDISTTVNLIVEDEPQVTNELQNEMTGALNKQSNTAKLVKFFNLFVAIKEKNTNEPIATIDELKDKISVTIQLPQDLRTVPEGYNRRYYIVRNHGEKTEILDAKLTENGLGISFDTDKFSTYALAYEDVKKTEGEKLDNPKTGDNIGIYIAILVIVTILGTTIVINSKKIQPKH